MQSHEKPELVVELPQEFECGKLRRAHSLEPLFCLLWLAIADSPGLPSLHFLTDPETAFSCNSSPCWDEAVIEHAKSLLESVLQPAVARAHPDINLAGTRDVVAGGSPLIAARSSVAIGIAAEISPVIHAAAEHLAIRTLRWKARAHRLSKPGSSYETF